MTKTNKKVGLSNYLRKHWVSILFYLIFLVANSALNILITIIMAEGIELATLKQVEEAIRMMLYSGGICLIVHGNYYVMEMLYLRTSTALVSELNLDLAKQAFKLNSKTYTDHGTGVFVSRIINDPLNIIDKLVNIVDRIATIARAFIMLVYISVLNLWIGLILIGSIGIGAIFEIVKVKKLKTNTRKVKKLEDKINSLTTEIVKSEKDIKSLGLEERLAVVSGENYRAYRNADRKRWETNVNWSISRNLFLEIISTIIMIMGIIFLDKAALTLASFLIIYRNENQVWNFVWGIGKVWEDVTSIKIATERMFQLFDEDEFITEKFGTKNIKKIVGNIEFKNVSFTFKDYEYPSIEDKVKARKKKEKLEKKIIVENNIFKDLNFKIEPNTTVAFVGKSGSGKSTILNLMSKMIECDDGQVLIDNVDIKELSKQTLRKSISLVNQFPYIFDMSIKENLLLAKPKATNKEIEEAIKKASLNDFIKTLPKGLDTAVGESGIKLSGGQKQRLAIARALLRKSSIILFDESTSSLDNFAQEEVKRSIDGLKGSSTIVIVAHRLSTIKDVDKIFFLDSGKIVDEGTFEELFKKNKTFKTMFLAENI